MLQSELYHADDAEFRTRSDADVKWCKTDSTRIARLQ